MRKITPAQVEEINNLYFLARLLSIEGFEVQTQIDTDTSTLKVTSTSFSEHLAVYKAIRDYKHIWSNRFTIKPESPKDKPIYLLYIMFNKM